MCGRYTLSAGAAALAERFSLSPEETALAPRYNIAPGQDAPVIGENKGRRLRLLRWGLVPSWAKDGAPGRRPINARAETLREKPSFREAFAKRRCLIPADGFYEWRREPGRRVPMHFRLKNGAPFSFAGIWERWRDARGNEIRTFAIITTEANELMRPFHPRMPAILRPENETAWLEAAAGTERAASLLTPYPSKEMEISDVSTAVLS